MRGAVGAGGMIGRQSEIVLVLVPMSVFGVFSVTRRACVLKLSSQPRSTPRA